MGFFDKSEIGVDNFTTRSGVRILIAAVLLVVLNSRNGIGSAKPAVQVCVGTAVGTKRMKFDLRRFFANRAGAAPLEDNWLCH